MNKYKWHDLRKDTNDLPDKNKTIIACCSDFDEKYVTAKLCDDEKFDIERICGCVGWKVKVIAWKYIDEFKDE